MDQLLVRIKERVAQRDSPIKTVKGVVEAIGMTEGGFYTMLKRGTTKTGTVLAIANALKVEASLLTDDSDSHSETNNFGEDVLQRITRDIHEMKQVFEEQLRAKDRQLEAKDGQIRQLLDLLGKLERAIMEPLSAEAGEFEVAMHRYYLGVIQAVGLESFLPQLLFDYQSGAKSVARS